MIYVCYLNIKIWSEWKKNSLRTSPIYVTGLWLNKLSIHSEENKNKSVLYSAKNRKRKTGPLDIQYGGIKIKQYSKVTYLSCELEESLSGEARDLKNINKINDRLKFLYKKNKYLTPYLERLICNNLIQPHFHYACSAWYPNLNKKF